MLKSIAAGGKAIYIVPLKALASEKYDRFLEFSKLDIKEGGVKVGIATGRLRREGRVPGPEGHHRGDLGKDGLAAA